MDIDIKSTHATIDFLNDILSKYCGKSLFIEFNYFETMTMDKSLDDFDIYDPESETPLMLCLFRGRKCISSITCKLNIKENAIEISSKTNELYQGKKYNLFLRYAIVLILHDLEYKKHRYNTRKSHIPLKFHSIISRAVNPISILAMAKHFYARNEKFNAYMNTHGLTYDNLTLNDTKQFYDELRYIPDDLQEDEIEDYYETYIEPYDPVVMTINLQDDTTVQNIRDKILNILILCPEKKRTRKVSISKKSQKSRKRRVNESI